MTKLNLISLSRNEMRNIMAGGRSKGLSEGSDCVDQCSTNADCSSNPCGPSSGGGTQTCGTIHCAGTNSLAKKVCTCWQG